MSLDNSNVQGHQFITVSTTKVSTSTAVVVYLLQKSWAFNKKFVKTIEQLLPTTHPNYWRKENTDQNKTQDRITIYPSKYHLHPSNDTVHSLPLGARQATPSVVGSSKLTQSTKKQNTQSITHRHPIHPSASPQKRASVLGSSFPAVVATVHRSQKTFTDVNPTRLFCRPVLVLFDSTLKPQDIHRVPFHLTASHLRRQLH